MNGPSISFPHNSMKHPTCSKENTGQWRPLLQFLIISFVGTYSLSASAEAMLVTRTSLGVQVKDSSGTRDAPAGAFPLLDGQSLIIPQNGIAVILSNGNAEQIVGPKTFSTDSTIGSGDVATNQDALANVLSRQSSTNSVGATRGGGNFTLLRPIEGTSLVTLSKIQWKCDSCEKKDIEVINLLTFDSLWSGSGSLQMKYEGDPLMAGDYAIKVDDNYLAFKIVDPTESAVITEAAIQAKRLASDLSMVDQVAVEAAIWSHAGMPTEALYVVDQALLTQPQNAELQQLLHSYQLMILPNE